ncbi:MAG TPA: iron-sulfur cluster repair di-iron protein [Vicinamibacterales bacterium]|jgi:regulator of cell morphogenesis and NO signaling|nr:iron-sulfur cluster repair di-iron protein [Acidobacteriota bacterium]HQX80627.1 iron-sulfur cluster repair di-iron protein [Vicinamibacterales bacterium]
MEFTKDMHVSEAASASPATIKVFQQHGIDFCCGGHRPIAEACAEHGLDVDRVLTELARSTAERTDEQNWQQAPMSDLVAHIQARFHQPLREELPRLSAMIDKVVERHGEHYPAMLGPLQREFRGLMSELLDHMSKEDQVLFPAIVAIDRGQAADGGSWIAGPVEVMEHEHVQAGAALAAMRQVTGDYQLPAGACPTFQGLFYGLEQLERDMHVHIHLENNILFPRAIERGRA